MFGKDFISIHDFTPDDVEAIFELAKTMKANPANYRTSLSGQVLAMIFQKPSTRTRVSFEVGIYQLGGTGLYLGANDLQLGRGETIADTARVLSRYANGIMARTFGHDVVMDLAQFATVPVINGLTDLLHPCQAVADYFTIREKKGNLRGLKLAYVGDGNNVAHSLMFGATKVGMHIAVATPKSYTPDPNIMKLAKADAKIFNVKVEWTTDAEQAVRDADVVYTDVWASMGQEKERARRVKIFKKYQVSQRLMSKARPDALFMHCLPAHRDEEVAAEVMDSPQSIVFDEAENRLHTQKAIMYTLMRR
ncbi:MAG: ornithine carbamoyltransferase [Acidobacteria bacterium]|nr:ornithine carbamoyltransferase [Acidobacteriota bacterium]MBI3656888.1 ornithine carbamoyltransferase [Acidobacteriota bacterium]